MQLRTSTNAIALGIAAIVTGAIGLAAPPAAAAVLGHRIRPNQEFGALVNQRDGSAGRVAIAMACFGPITPGQTGHPVKGQTLTVFRARHGGTTGNTGPNGTSVGAFFGAPPPNPSAAASTNQVDFTRYATKALATSLVLPCSGQGQVTFVPLPLLPGGGTVGVPVRFVPQP